MVATHLPPEVVAAIDFNYQQIATSLGLPIPSSAVAAILGISEADYQQYVDDLASDVKASAKGMLQNPQVAELVERLAGAGQRILMMGDSITTCRYSYAELLRHLLEPKGVELFNWGVGGYTSNHALELCYNTSLLSLNPDLIFLSYGVNDAKYFGDTPKMLVSHEEYIANMGAVVNALQSQSHARLVLLTPTPVVESIANHLSPGFHHQMRWDNADIKKFGDGLREIGKAQQIPVVDVFAGFSITPDPALFLDDGVHPNRIGERLILEQIAAQLNLSGEDLSNGK